CTNNWPSDVLRDVGNSQVHHHIIKSTLDLIPIKTLFVVEDFHIIINN
ncbi:22455_t:CDS:1, partial [Dentiscutata erythropus]